MADEPLNPPPRVPLGTDGTALWESIADVYVLTPGEREILAQACACADTIARLDKLLAEAEPDLMIPGNRPGTFVLHPAISERRMVAALQAQSIARLRLPDLDDEDEESGAASPANGERRPMSRSESGRIAARARWGR
ncbi:hypothetical protein [Actinoallomurus iriomotensis]|uniref:Uncharacterized protein n=1 Tax=Actinoallomurus iriomotensis TaxID=478107 RepID=A0A9W6S5W9_9ACTN|nr:hypothetical protein [Actinoallomurus iriomotensis]GLY87766.1 hypothetical protein Airi02_056950 [Actinoallomurus iriomotensis]